VAKEMTTTSYALLGLLSLRSWSTYELAKQTERSLGWFWPRTERKIYDEARRLAESGHATASTEPTGSRQRTVYRITAKGRQALSSWLDRPSATTKLESEAQVRVFFADAGDLFQLRATLTMLGSEARERRDLLVDLIRAGDDPDYPFAGRQHINTISIRFQLDYHRMTADWADWALAQVERWNDVDDPGDWDWRDAVDECDGTQEFGGG
jgi:DNA-binding PadR family transcriptional regulator